MIPRTGETLFYIDLDAVTNLSEAAVIDLCRALGLTLKQDERLLLLESNLPEDKLLEAHCELSHQIKPAHLAVHLRTGRAAA